MKTTYLYIVIAVFIPFFYSCQTDVANEYQRIEGTWKGNFKNNNDLYPARLEIVKSKENKDSYHLVFSNSRNEKFYVTKSSITEEPSKTLIITIEEAGLSYCPNCKFNQGKITMEMIDDHTMNFSVSSVGPDYWRTYDVKEGMPDISDLVLTKEVQP